jgi:hypothetical protein
MAELTNIDLGRSSRRLRVDTLVKLLPALADHTAGSNRTKQRIPKCGTLATGAAIFCPNESMASDYGKLLLAARSIRVARSACGPTAGPWSFSQQRVPRLRAGKTLGPIWVANRCAEPAARPLQLTLFAANEILFNCH